MARKGGAPDLDVLGQLQLAAFGGAQAEEFRGPVSPPRGGPWVCFGAPLGHESETEPGRPAVFHPQDGHAVGQSGLLDFGYIVSHIVSFCHESHRRGGSRAALARNFIYSGQWSVVS